MSCIPKEYMPKNIKKDPFFCERCKKVRTNEAKLVKQWSIWFNKNLRKSPKSLKKNIQAYLVDQRLGLQRLGDGDGTSVSSTFISYWCEEFKTILQSI